MSDNTSKVILTLAYLLFMAFGIWISTAYGATVTHDLTNEDAWSALVIKQPCRLMYGGTIPHDGGSVTIPLPFDGTIRSSTIVGLIHVDLYHRYQKPGTGGIRIGGLSFEPDADGWQVTESGRILHRETQPRAWAGKRVKATLELSMAGLAVRESGGEWVTTGGRLGSMSEAVLWSSVAAVENAPRWLSVSVVSPPEATPTPTEIPTIRPTPSPTPTEAPTVIPTPTPVGYPWVWTLTLGPEGPVGRWFRAPTLLLPDGTIYTGETMPLAPWFTAPVQTDGDGGER